MPTYVDCYVSLFFHVSICSLLCLRYRSDVTSHSLAILLLDSQNSSLFSRQLSAENPRESSPRSSYKSPHSNIDSLDSLEGSTE